jgi:poly(ribitol-phosphate) beta-N-acetylglucosaminyltransferase
VPRVSVIVPVYNPGNHIDDCIRTLLAQTLPDVELIFVDDGSTDGTPARLDALAAEHPHVRVEHIPNSGWPGRPRNIGLDMARGDYVYFVDNDDWLGEEALARLHGMAVTDDADIVIGKVVGHGKSVTRTLFRRNVHSATFEPQMLALLTPHKLFRRAFLTENGLRFPEGRRRLEDHHFVVAAYFAARGISIVADYPCYHWVLRDPEVNASFRSFDAEGYFENVREVLDIVEAHTEPGDFRDKLLVHWYRGKMLGRVGGESFLNRVPEGRRELLDAVRELATERFGPQMTATLPLQLRLRSRLLRDGNLDALVHLAEFETSLQAKTRLRRVRGDGTHLVLDLQARLGRQNLHLRRDGERLLWVLPPSLRGAFDSDELDVTEDIESGHVVAYLRSIDDETEYLLPVRTRIEYEDGPEPGLVRPVLDTTIRVTPTTAAGGAPLPAGQWDVRTGVRLAGFYSVRRVRDRQTDEPVILTSLPPGRVHVGDGPPPEPSLRTRLGRSAPWIGATVRRTRAAVAGT